MPRISYVNGRYVPHSDATVHMEDRGFLFADGVYEAFALINGVIADEAGHLDRLSRSLAELKIAMPLPRRSLQMVMRELVLRNRIKNGFIYAQVTRGTAPRDFKFPDLSVKPTLVMMIRPLSFDIAARKAAVKKVYTVEDIRWKRRDIKSTALLAQVLAKQAAVEKGGYEAWMVDDQGFITEGASTNAWIVTKDGVLVTRPTANTMILKGVTRNAIQSLCLDLKIKLEERPFTAKESYTAAEAFISAAGTLLMPVGWIDDHQIGNGKIGAVTGKILDCYMDYVAGLHGAQRNWTAE